MDRAWSDIFIEDPDLFKILFLLILNQICEGLNPALQDVLTRNNQTSDSMETFEKVIKISNIKVKTFYYISFKNSNNKMQGNWALVYFSGPWENILILWLY